MWVFFLGFEFFQVAIVTVEKSRRFCSSVVLFVCFENSLISEVFI